MILHTCTKNYDHMFGYRIIACEKKSGHLEPIFAFLPLGC